MKEGGVSLSMRFLWNHGQIPFQTGFTDNFASNEIIVPGITAADVFANLLDISIWPSYYDNVADVYFYNHDGPILKKIPVFVSKPLGSLLKLKSLNWKSLLRASREDFPGLDGWKEIPNIDLM